MGGGDHHHAHALVYVIRTLLRALGPWLGLGVYRCSSHNRRVDKVALSARKTVARCSGAGGR